VHPLMMGLEEHLIGMFRGDAEFHEDASPSHLGGGIKKATIQEMSAPAAVPATAAVIEAGAPAATAQATEAAWGVDAEKELRKIPFFVRGKARRNTELYARERGVPLITVDTLYDAKAHFSR
jgi:light-independent protochlorophyllide reductase subunit B